MVSVMGFIVNRKILGLKRERKSAGGLPKQRVKCHLIKGLMNELRAEVFEGAPERSPSLQGEVGCTGCLDLRPPHVGRKIKSAECSQRFDI